MNTIQLAGQAITGTNYTTLRLFNFSPDLVRETAESFLASGVSELEIPEGVLNPEGRATDGCDRETLRATIANLPSETKVVGTYFGGAKSTADYVKTKKKRFILRRFTIPTPQYRLAATKLQNAYSQPTLPQRQCGCSGSNC